MRSTTWLLAVLAACLGGCESMQGLLDAAPKPTASIKAVRFQDLAADALTLAFDVEVKNPYDLPLPLVNLDYALGSGGKSLLSGNADVQGTVPARGAKTVTLPARLVFADVLAALSGVKPGAVVPYEADLKLGVDAPGAGPIALPISRRGEFPVPAVPDIQVEAVEWKKLTMNEAGGVVTLKVTNTNQFPVDLNRLGYALSLGGTEVASSAVSQRVQFGKGASEKIAIPVNVSPIKLGMGFFNLIRGEGSGYELSGAADLGTPFGALNMPYRRAGQTVFK